MKKEFIQSKNGFTLAEVLITLVVIGVVAAMTISPIINTYVESSTVAKVKKALSILGQAKKLAEVQNGSIEGWNYSEGNTSESATQFWNYLKPHIAVTKDCGFDSDCYPVSSYTFQGGNIDYSHSYYHIILQDGSVMWFRTGFTGKCTSSEMGLNNVCASFWIDVNGVKKPNTVGKDIFIYAMNTDGVYPTVLNDCYKNMDGAGCSSYIIKNGNMKYLH